MPRLTLVVAALTMVALAAVVIRGQEDRTATKAKRIHQEAIVFDTHIDTTDRLQGGWKFEDRHPAPSSHAPDASSVDLPRMREGGLDAAFFSVFVPGTITGGKAVSLARAEFDKLRILVDTHPKDLALCLTAADVRRAHADGKIGVLIGVEGGHMINESLDVLQDYARLGARYLTLTHTVNVTWADSSSEPPKVNGLSDFGKQVVRELNRLGMMVDVSHISDKAFWDVLEVSQAPVIASHSACRALCGHPRNLTDEMIKALAAHDGVIQINFMAGYIDEALYQEQKKREPQLDTLRAELERQYPGPENAEKRWREVRAAYEKMGPAPKVSWERIVDHIDHAVKLAGSDHVGLGSDFDGATMPEGMDECSQLPKITAELLRRGYKESDVKKILGGNTLRVMEQAEKVGRKLSSR
ncbi:MAG TPA: dipeptidase [Vicinamibacterales bacterium]|jgi:membrane dipeptidase